MTKIDKALKRLSRAVDSFVDSELRKRVALQKAIDGGKILQAKIDSTIRNSNRAGNKHNFVSKQPFNFDAVDQEYLAQKEREDQKEMTAMIDRDIDILETAGMSFSEIEKLDLNELHEQAVECSENQRYKFRD